TNSFIGITRRRVDQLPYFVSKLASLMFSIITPSTLKATPCTLVIPFVPTSRKTTSGYFWFHSKPSVCQPSERLEDELTGACETMREPSNGSLWAFIEGVIASFIPAQPVSMIKAAAIINFNLTLNITLSLSFDEFACEANSLLVGMLVLRSHQFALI